ncbi:MAG: HAD family hydrolase [Candidatus Altiarchaeota archaeon]|nr:HAD family hydrolase [Candidatus Altiarchaeota archaeon]
MIVVFDLDGTLVDASVLHAKILSKIVGKKIDASEIYSSSSLKFLVMENLPRGKWSSIKDLTRQHESEMIKNVKLTEPMPGVHKMLQDTHFKKALFTSANKRLANALLDHVGLKGYFDIIITASDVSKSKPDPEGLYLISNQSHEDNMVMIGNSDRDLLAAKKAGAIPILFTPSKESTSVAEYVVTDLRELPELVASLEQ